MRKRLLNIVFVSIFVLFSGIMLTGCLPHHHVWSDWAEFSPRTCTEDQILIRTCEKCQTSEKRVGEEAEGHVFKTQIIEPTPTTNGYTRHHCDCGAEYKDNETCLVTFENASNNITININNLPQTPSKVVAKDSLLQEIPSTDLYKPEEYRVYLNSSSYTKFDLNQKITESVKITVMWETIIPTELTEEEKEFYDLILKLKKLENISKDYNTEKGLTVDPNIRALQYIRQARYNDDEWNMFGGTMESDFAEYVLNNQGSYDLQSLQTLQTLNNPFANEKIDFVHMMAIINVFAKGSITNTTNDIVGWGGDLCQLVLELKGKNLTGTALQAKAYELFGAENSTFSTQDLLADLDAFSIMLIYNQNSDSKSISEAVKEYYLNYTSYRKQIALSILFPDAFDSSTSQIKFTQEELANAIITRLSGNMAVQLWCMRNGLNFTNDAGTFYAAAMAFAKYLIVQ